MPDFIGSREKRSLLINAQNSPMSSLIFRTNTQTPLVRRSSVICSSFKDNLDSEEPRRAIECENLPSYQNLLFQDNFATYSPNLMAQSQEESIDKLRNNSLQNSGEKCHRDSVIPSAKLKKQMPIVKGNTFANPWSSWRFLNKSELFKFMTMRSQSNIPSAQVSYNH